jgi:hypothetical protein
MDVERLPLKSEDAQKLLDTVDTAHGAIRESMFDDWNTLDKAYRMGAVEEDGRRGMGLIFATIQAKKPYLYHQDPSVWARPLRHTDGQDQELQAKIASAGVEDQFAHGDFGGVFDLVIDDEEIFGGGVVQIIFDDADISVPLEDYEMAVDEEEVDDDDDEEADRARLVTERLEELGMTPDRHVSGIRLLRVSPYNWIYPPGYTEIRQMPWCAVRRLMRPEDVVAEYGTPAKHLTADLVKATNETDGDRPTRGYLSDQAGHLELLEVWHYEYRKRTFRRSSDGGTHKKLVRELHVTTLCRQTSKSGKGPTVLRNRLSPFDMPGFPFEDFRLNRTPDRYYGPSTAALMLPVAVNIQRLMDGAVEGLLASMAEKILYNPDTIHKTEVRKLESNRPSLVAARDKRGVGNSVKKLERTAFPQEAYGVSNLLRTFMSEVSGADESMRGGKSSAGSATEVAYRASVAEGRAGSDTRKFEKFVNRIAVKVFQIMQQYFDADRWVRVAGEDMPIAFTRNDITGQFDIRIHSGSMKQQSPDLDREAVLGFATYLGQTAQALTMAGVPPQNLTPIIDKLLALWDIESPSMLDAFAQITNTGLQSAGQAPGFGQTSPDGQAANPATGETLNAPSANPLVTGAAAAGTPPSQGQ